MQNFHSTNGWLVLDKPFGISSNFVGSKLKRIFKQKKIGHAGTLDPFATGLLALALGEATKTMPYIMNHNKTYEFTLKFGVSTATEDIEGEVIATSSHVPSVSDIQKIIPQFTGKITQIPPKYAAIKINGQRAYKLCRRGVEFDIPAREVNISKLTLNSLEGNLARFTVDCETGTYVRALGRDIALSLGSVGHLLELRRTRVGNLCVSSAITLEKLLKIDNNSAEGFLLPIGSVLDDIPAVSVSSLEAEKIRKGMPVIVCGENSAAVSAWCDKDLVALGSIREGIFYPNRVINY